MIKTTICVEKVSNLVNENNYVFIYESMPEIRKKHVDELKLIHDKYRSVAAYALLAKALKDNQIDITDLTYNVDENGKPYFINSDINFSISHSQEYIAIAISNSKIGIDIQKISEVKESVINLIFNEDDLAFYSSSKDKNSCFTKIWTFKESYAKCIGKGLKTPFKSIFINYSNYTCDSFSLNSTKVDNYIISICSAN